MVAKYGYSGTAIHSVGEELNFKEKMQPEYRAQTNNTIAVIFDTKRPIVAMDKFSLQVKGSFVPNVERLNVIFNLYSE